MKIPKSKFGLIAVVIYLLSFFAAIGYEITYPLEKFSGLFLTALTFPWSIIMTVLLDFLGIIDSLSDTATTLILVPGAIPNIMFLYWIWAAIGQSLRKKSA